MNAVNALLNDFGTFESLNTITGKTLALVLGLFLLVLLFQFRSRGNKGKPLPGPTGLPIVGYFPFLGNEAYETFRDLSKKYGNIFRIYLGSKYIVVCNDWTYLKEILGKTETLNRPPKVFDAIPNGLGLAGENGQEWSEQRRFVSKAMKDIGFGRPRWEELLQEAVGEVSEEIQSRKGQPMDMEEIFDTTFTNNVMTLTFGYRFSNDDPALKKISSSQKYLLQELPVLDFSFFLPKLTFILSKLGNNKASEIQKQVKEFAEGVEGCVRKAMKNIENGEQDSFLKTYYAEVVNNKEKNLKNSFTAQSLLANVQTLIIGGSDTTKHAFIWLLISMAKFPDVQDKVHKELDTVFGRDGQVYWADKNKVPYTFATILESMRFFTLAPIPAFRMVGESFKVHEYNVPKGAYIISNFWALHKDSKYWPNPEKFQPERFLQDNGKQVNFKVDSFAPFSYGKRSCPGEMIAQMTLFLYFSSLMQKFQVLPPGEDVKYEVASGLAHSAQNVKLRFVERN